MTRSASAPKILTERLVRPQRVGLFGQRGVGKTTLLTMLYREAVGGRLPGLRLAAADARTALYLSDKILQLETGQPLPATLAETELRFQLYHEGQRLELVVKDYQGEHVALGKEESIRDFLRDCDAVYLCLDAAHANSAAGRLQAQQEAEQLIEDYLAAERQESQHRPTAILLTKADRLAPAEPDAALSDLIEQRFNMTKHALATHCPQHAVFAVSSLGGPIREGQLQPRGLSEPLIWLSGALQAQDEARLERLGTLAPRDLSLLERGVTAFARRYPTAPATTPWRRRLGDLRRSLWRRRVVAGCGLAATLFLSIWGYDAWGQRTTRRFEAEHPHDPAAVKAEWETFQRWHPTRALLSTSEAHAEVEHLRELDAQHHEQQRGDRLAELRRQASDAEVNSEAVWQQFQQFRADFPENDLEADLQKLRDQVKQQRERELEQKAQQAFAELENPSIQGDLPALVTLADRFLRDYGETRPAVGARRLREACLRRLDENDYESARAYSIKQPLNFYSGRERYQDYLRKHPAGAFAADAAEALTRLDTAWDKHDFRAVADCYQHRVTDTKELESLCRSYLAVHPRGRFRDSAQELLRWTEQVTRDGDYRVTLKRGNFEHKVAATFSRGPSLSVEIEVNGVRHGPSNIVARRYDPDWDYEFPRRIRWKLGDSVKIRVKDNYYWDRPICEIASDPNDPLALRLLCGEVQTGANWLQFECDFKMPVLPAIE